MSEVPQLDMILNSIQKLLEIGFPKPVKSHYPIVLEDGEIDILLHILH